jgi:hypothetical protein
MCSNSATLLAPLGTFSDDPFAHANRTISVVLDTPSLAGRVPATCCKAVCTRSCSSVTCVSTSQTHTMCRGRSCVQHKHVQSSECRARRLHCGCVVYMRYTTSTATVQTNRSYRTHSQVETTLPCQLKATGIRIRRTCLTKPAFTAAQVKFGVEYKESITADGVTAVCVCSDLNLGCQTALRLQFKAYTHAAYLNMKCTKYHC